MPAKKPKKDESLIETYQYKGDGELLTDIPSEPINTHAEPLDTQEETTRPEDTPTEQETIQSDVIHDEPVPVDHQAPQSNRLFYNSIVASGQAFTISVNGIPVHDSTNPKSTIDFQDDCFTTNGKRYSYGGMSLKFKK